MKPRYAKREDLEEFVKLVKEGLKTRLEAVSCELIDAGLIQVKGRFQEDMYSFYGLARRVITRQTVKFKVNICADIGKTEPEDVQEIVANVANSIIANVYNEKSRIITLH